MEMTDYVKEFRTLQKSGKIRVADFCRERMLDYYEMVEALKKDKFLSELPEEQVVSADLEITDFPCDHPDPKATSFIREVFIQTPTDLKVSYYERNGYVLSEKYLDREYFRKALKFETDNGIARRFLEKIQLIYKFEKRYKKDKLPPEKVKEYRQMDILPILGDILQELNHYATSAAEECGCLLMKAIHYAIAEWNGLMRYTSDGRYRADNNMTEQLMCDLA